MTMQKMLTTFALTGVLALAVATPSRADWYRDCYGNYDCGMYRSMQLLPGYGGSVYAGPSYFSGAPVYAPAAYVYGNPRSRGSRLVRRYVVWPYYWVGR